MPEALHQRVAIKPRITTFSANPRTRYEPPIELTMPLSPGMPTGFGVLTGAPPGLSGVVTISPGRNAAASIETPVETATIPISSRSSRPRGTRRGNSTTTTVITESCTSHSHDTTHIDQATSAPWSG